MYKTGDLARYQADGDIVFLGRLDSQVKIRGYRIEVGEIETALSKHPVVQECVVVPKEDTSGDKRLVAYVVCKERIELVTDELHAFLHEKLPSYMVPATFMLLQSIPLTPSGKIDRRKLPEIAQLRQVQAKRQEQVLPSSQVERVIAAIWQELLQVEKVNLHDNFFDLGGHSLLIVRVAARLREVLHIDLSMIDLFKYPTVSALAHYIHPDLNDGSIIQDASTKVQSKTRVRKTLLDDDIAIVGMAGKFPGARNIEEFSGKYSRWERDYHPLF